MSFEPTSIVTHSVSEGRSITPTVLESWKPRIWFAGDARLREVRHTRVTPLPLEDK
jgi:hypothetical protein